MNSIAIQLTKKHEGMRLKPYLCTEGKTTIGYGRNLDDNGITESEAELLLEHDIQRAQQDAEQFAFFKALNETRQAVIIDMLFNLGVSRFRQFEKMLAALEKHDYAAAADEMLDSKWAKQVGVRAKNLNQLMISGEYHVG